jgi:hypothetical protein
MMPVRWVYDTKGSFVPDSPTATFGHIAVAKIHKRSQLSISDLTKDQSA